MLKTIRSLNTGWIIFFLGIGAILSGLKLNKESVDAIDGTTLLCIDNGCIQVQAYSNIIIGILMILVGVYLKCFKQ